MFVPCSYKKQYSPISGVINSGGVLADAVLASQSAGSMHNHTRFTDCQIIYANICKYKIMCYSSCWVL